MKIIAAFPWLYFIVWCWLISSLIRSVVKVWERNRFPMSFLDVNFLPLTGHVTLCTTLYINFILKIVLCTEVQQSPTQCTLKLSVLHCVMIYISCNLNGVIGVLLTPCVCVFHRALSWATQLTVKHFPDLQRLQKAKRIRIVGSKLI